MAGGDQIVSSYSWQLLFKSLLMQIISWIRVFVFSFDGIITSVLIYLMHFYSQLRLDEVNQKFKNLLLSKQLNQNQI
jgi:hypothetical protein